MTCKDCIHHDLCFDNGTLFINYAKGKEKENAEIYCPFKKFKNTADVEEVVRCKDCVHKKHGIQGNYCGLTDFLIKDDDFCSHGERKDTE